VRQIRPNQYKDFLKAVLVQQPQLSVFVSGKVGAGKSQCTRQVTDELNFEFRDVRLSLLDATDLRGLPMIDKEKKITSWTRPAFLPAEDYDKDVVLFLDEFSCANAAIQNAALQLVLDRQIGEYKLPSKCRVVCAGNRITDGAYVFKLSSALTNRFINIDFEPDYEDWKQYAYEKNINPLIIGFHNFTNGEMLHNFNPSIIGAFATPRSWFFLDRIMSLGLENGTLREAINGTIGEAAGTEFYGWLKIYRDLPDVQRILKGEDIVPKDRNVCFALCAALIGAVRQDKSKVDRLIKYSLLLEKEFAVVLVKDLMKTDLKGLVLVSKSFDAWTKQFRELVM
jgi:hypothetical protein